MFGNNQFNPYGNNFGGYGYGNMNFQNPYGGYSNNIGQNTSQQQLGQQNVQQQSTVSGPDWIMVPTMNDVQNVGVQPGGKAWVMVQNEAIFALLTANNVGVINREYFRFEKFDPTAFNPTPQQPQTFVNPEYITHEELEQRLTEFAASLKPATRKKEVVSE